MPAQYILGISAYYHDSAAVLARDGEVMAAAQEERFSRVKHDASFPARAIKYVLEEEGVTMQEIDKVVFYDKPFIKFERLLETYHAFAPRGLFSFLHAIPVWIKEKLFLKKTLRDELRRMGGRNDLVILFPEHHLSHAASAFYPSPFQEAAILTLDGVGEWATATLGHGNGSAIKILKELRFPHSVGLLYASFTYFLGFKVNSGEYKLMGLAPYGNPASGQTKEFVQLIKDKLVDICPDGSIVLNMKYFNYATGLTMVQDKKWEKLFKLARRKPEDKIEPGHMNLALAIQLVTEEIVMKMARAVKAMTGSRYLVMAGGVALNSVANGKLLQEGIFEDIWVQPAATDAGAALGAALATRYIYDKKERFLGAGDGMKGAFLGPSWHAKQLALLQTKHDASFLPFDTMDELIKETAKIISEGKIVGWFQGRMEFGPRALGNRSILADARNPDMQKKLNLRIKYREGFRPFAPSVLKEDAAEYFHIDRPSPYMLMVVPMQEKHRKTVPADYNEWPLYDKLYFQRSGIPAVTHVDYSARPQTVSKATNPLYWQLINEFKRLTGCSVIINTSFNVRGEPIVCAPDEAYRCFMSTEMDYLVIGNALFDKKKQAEGIHFSRDFEMD